MSTGNLGPALPGTIAPAEVENLRAAWGQDPTDIGLGLYNPGTGEIHVGSYDTTGRQGHDGLQANLGILDRDRANWRGFVVSSHGQAINGSGFNLSDGGTHQMRPEYWAEVEQALRQAGLL